MRKQFLFIFSFIFLLSLLPLFSATATFLHPIPDVILNASSGTFYKIEVEQVAPGAVEDSTYLSFVNPDNQTLVTLYLTDYDSMDWYNTSKFNISLHAPTNSQLIKIYSTGQNLARQKFTIGVADVPFSSQNTEDFYLSFFRPIVGNQASPYQIISPANVFMSINSERTVDLSSYMMTDSWTSILLTYTPNAIGSPTEPEDFLIKKNTFSQFTLNGSTFSFSPISTSSGETVFMKTVSGSIPLNGNMTLIYIQRPYEYPYEIEQSGLNFTTEVYGGDTMNANTYSNNFLYFNFSIGNSSSPSSNPISNPTISTTGGFFGSAASMLGGFFPDKDSLSLKQQMAYVLVFMFFLAVAIFGAFLVSSKSIPKAAVMIVGGLEMMAFFYFISIGYISVGILVVSVICILGLIFLMRRG